MQVRRWHGYPCPMVEHRHRDHVTSSSLQTKAATSVPPARARIAFVPGSIITGVAFDVVASLSVATLLPPGPSVTSASSLIGVIAGWYIGRRAPAGSELANGIAGAVLSFTVACVVVGLPTTATEVAMWLSIGPLYLLGAFLARLQSRPDTALRQLVDQMDADDASVRDDPAASSSARAIGDGDRLDQSTNGPAH